MLLLTPAGEKVNYTKTTTPALKILQNNRESFWACKYENYILKLMSQTGPIMHSCKSVCESVLNQKKRIILKNSMSLKSMLIEGLTG